jgi:hypothetical protein
LLLVKYCCDNFENFIEHLENAYEDDEFMDEDVDGIMNSVYDTPSTGRLDSKTGVV